MSEQLLTVEELAKELSVPPSWVYSRTRLTGPDTIPIFRCGKYCRFRLTEVLNWLERKDREVNDD